MDAMGIIAWIVIGGIAGWLASIIMKTNRNQGWLIDIIVGIIGAFIGGLVFNALGANGVTGFNVYSLIVAFVGAIILLAILRAIGGRGSTI